MFALSGPELEISAQDTMKRILANTSKPVILVDVREKFEWSQGHIKDAVHIPVNQIKARIGSLAGPNDGVEFIVYCRSGARSMNALNMMKSLGFKKVKSMAGGTLKWTAAGFNLVK